MLLIVSDVEELKYNVQTEVSIVGTYIIPSILNKKNLIIHFNAALLPTQKLFIIAALFRFI